MLEIRVKSLLYIIKLFWENLNSADYKKSSVDFLATFDMGVRIMQWGKQF